MVAAAVGAGLLAGCAPGRAPAAARAAAPVAVVSNSACGAGWTGVRESGRQQVQVRNGSSVAADVRLMTAAGGVAGEFEGLGPGVTRTMRLDLAPGSYRFRCRMEGYPAKDGPLVRVSGSGGSSPSPAVKAVTDRDLYGPARTYQARVATRMGPLAHEVRALREAARAGDRTRARAAWRRAHAVYGRLGAAYGAFGELGDRIDGLPAGLPKGVDDPSFTGFHRVERALWGGSTDAAAHAAERLDADVRKLRAQFPQDRIDTLDLGLRAHEILEDTLRVTLAGKDDFGSGDGLATAEANLAGTRDVLAVLRPVLRGRYAMGPTDAALARLGDVLASLGSAPVHTLTRAQRERVDAALGNALERLAPIAEITSPRRMS